MRSSADPEAVFTYGAPQLRFGPGASAEIGYDLGQLGARPRAGGQRPAAAAAAAACPRPVAADDLAGIFSRSMELW
ncbi:MAG TPA: hypothetical protein VFX25_15350 [Streptosporangiaceae bacterium]|nr:hypothetical protein [Streptosporangiaceae bacterium]